jgi:hypothetical protein
MTDNGELLEELKGIMGVTKGIARAEASYPTPASVAEAMWDMSLDVVSQAVLLQLAEMSWEEIAQLASLSLISERDLSVLCYAHGQGTSVFREEWRDISRKQHLPEGVDRGAFMAAVRYAPDAMVMTRTTRLARQMVSEAGSGVKAMLAKALPVMHGIFTGDGGVQDGDPQGDTAKARAYTGKGKAATKEYMSPEKAGSGEKVMTAPAFTNTKEQKGSRDEALSKIDKMIAQMTKAGAAAGKHPEEMFGMRWRDIHREKTRYS